MFLLVFYKFYSDFFPSCYSNILNTYIEPFFLSIASIDKLLYLPPNANKNLTMFSVSIGLEIRGDYYSR